jgi:metal-responsive CopG/Arc/MetJ family transcriptional regulator
MGRPRKAKTLTTVSIRLPQSVIDEIDQCADKLQEETPLLQVTRTDAVRYLIQTALEEFWKQRKKKR